MTCLRVRQFAAFALQGVGRLVELLGQLGRGVVVPAGAAGGVGQGAAERVGFVARLASRVGEGVEDRV